jgi:hypothetical protein
MAICNKLQLLSLRMSFNEIEKFADEVAEREDLASLKIVFHALKEYRHRKIHIK